VRRLFVGTLDGIFTIVLSNGCWNVASRNLEGSEVNAIVVNAFDSSVYAGVRGGGLYRSGDGNTWRRLGEGVLSDKVRALTLDPSNPDIVYVGTEPPALWKSEDGGRTWMELEGVRALAKDRKWTYPVPTIEPHVRGIAVAPKNSNRLCLATQVGGVLLSEDRGESWAEVRDPIDMDVHSVAFDPMSDELIYAATGGGERFPDPSPPPKGKPLYRSHDAGRSWDCITETLPRTYSVPVRIHPKDSSTLFLGVAEGPPPFWSERSRKANSAVMRSVDGGESWEYLTSGLPQPLANMVECIEFDPDEPDHIFIGLGGEGARYIKLNRGEVYHREAQGDPWNRIPVDLPIVYAMAAA